MAITSSTAADASAAPTLGDALETARAALSPHADPAAIDTGVTALLHGALTLLEMAQRSLQETANEVGSPATRAA